MAKNGLHLITPTSIAYTGTSASISANGSVTFSACTSLSLNGVFSADYDNYMIVFGTATSSGHNPIRLRMRASGADESSASNYYTYQRLLGYGTSVVGNRTVENSTRLGDSSQTQRNGHVVDVYGPYLAQPTALRSVVVSGELSATVDNYAATHSLSNAYDGFTVFKTESFTGRIAVYGMRK